VCDFLAYAIMVYGDLATIVVYTTEAKLAIATTEPTPFAP